MLKVKCCFYRTKHGWRWIIDAEPQQELCTVHANQRVRMIIARPLPCVDFLWGRGQHTNAQGTSLFRLAQQIPCTERPQRPQNTTEVCFCSQFWRLDVQDQGSSWLVFVRTLFLAYRWPSCCVLVWAQKERSLVSLPLCIRTLILSDCCHYSVTK